MNSSHRASLSFFALFLFLVLFGMARANDESVPFCDMYVASAERALQRMLTRYQEMSQTAETPLFQFISQSEVGEA